MFFPGYRNLQAEAGIHEENLTAVTKKLHTLHKS